MILQALAHGQVGDQVDAELAEVGCGSDAGAHEDLRGAEHAAAQDDLTGCADVLHFAVDLDPNAHRPAALEEHAVGQRMHEQGEVLAAQVGVEVALGRRVAKAVATGHLHGRDAFLGCAVVVVEDGYAERFARGVHEGLAHRAHLFDLGDGSPGWDRPSPGKRRRRLPSLPSA